MPFVALLLTLLAAALHAAWNYLAKSAGDTAAFMWWALLFGALGYGVYLALTAGFYLPPAVWPLYAVSSASELAFLAALIAGYREGDLSLVYPISRGSPPVFLAIVGALVLGERLPLLGYLGLAMMIGGIIIVSYQRLPPRDDSITAPSSDRSKSTSGSRAAAWALASGVFISVYSISDKIIVGAMSPLVYNWWVYAGMTLGWAPMVWNRKRLDTNLGELRRNFKRVIIGSVTTIGAYVAVLIAYTMTSASYVVAGRGTSVLIGALLGWFALGERLGRLRVAGAALMVCGLALMTLAT